MTVQRLGTLLFLGFFICCPDARLGAEPTSSSLSPTMPSRGTKSRAATFRVDFRVAVAAPAKTRKLRVWLPLPPSDGDQQISERRIETFPRQVAPSIESEPVFGNSFAYFEFDSPSGAQQIRHQFTATVHQLDWNVDYAAVERPEVWPESFDPFQRPDARADQAGEFRALVAQINERAESDSDRLLSAMEWVDQNLTYDHKQASLTADPMHALIHRRGHCSDYHGLCGTLAQKIGFPSRVVYGLQMFDKGSPSHCKLEVYLPPYGWVSYDLSETQKLAKQIAADKSLSAAQREARVGVVRERTMRGFRENTWLLVTRGVNYELAPRSSRPVSVIRTIYAEADGVPLPEPDPGNDQQRTFAWMTMHRVDELGSAARRFQFVP